MTIGQNELKTVCLIASYYFPVVLAWCTRIDLLFGCHLNLVSRSRGGSVPLFDLQLQVHEQRQLQAARGEAREGGAASTQPSHAGEADPR